MAANAGLAGSLLLAAMLLPGLMTAEPAPLFRQALLQWPASPFEVVVFHRGLFDETDERLVNMLRDAPKGTGANLEVFSVDLVGQVEDRLQVLWDTQTN